MSEALLTLVGTGGSMGVPMLGCSCLTCTSSDPRNQRTRTAALLTSEGKRAAIDVGPDFRTQMLRHNVEHLDGILLTHAHYDHIGGIDDLRAYYFRHHEPLPCLLSQETLDDIVVRYNYLFSKSTYETPHLQLQLVTGASERFLGKEIVTVSYTQLGMRVLGFRFGELAYLTDLYRPEESIYKALEGVRILIVSALRATPSPVHLTIDEAIAFSKRVGAEQTYFTHIAHETEHIETQRRLPKGIDLGYDGLEVAFEW